MFSKTEGVITKEMDNSHMALLGMPMTHNEALLIAYLFMIALMIVASVWGSQKKFARISLVALLASYASEALSINYDDFFYIAGELLFVVSLVLFTAKQVIAACWQVRKAVSSYK